MNISACPPHRKVTRLYNMNKVRNSSASRSGDYTPILEGLKQAHGSTMLGHFGEDDPWQTLIATILSARSRDETTEIVARELFRSYPDCRTLADAPVRKIEKLVKKTGFYKTKARRIISV